MIHPRFILAAGFCLAASLGHAAGLKFIHIPENADGPAIDAAQWSPCAKAPEPVAIKGVVIPAVPDCPIAGEKLPLIIISHGYGGWYLGHHDTAEALADAGFVVVAVNHPQANFADMSGANGLRPLRQRPADIKHTVDFMLGASPDAARIDPQRIGFYGFSQGGYTGLVVGGANPDFNKLPPRCADQKPGCPPASQQPARRELPPEILTHDVRIRAMVIADPLSIVFQTADSVKDVKIPLQLWGSQVGGGATASPETVAMLARLLPSKPDFRVVPNAVHFSFLTPCPPDGPSRPTCVDAPQGKVLDASLGCTIVICAASQNPSWHTVPFCVPVMRDLLAAMSEPGFSWPVCENAKTGAPRHEIYDRCPAAPCPLRADPWFFEVPDDGHGKRRIWFNLRPPPIGP